MNDDNVHGRRSGRRMLGRIGLSIATMLVVLAGCIEFVDAPGTDPDPDPDQGSAPSAFITVNEDGDNTAPAVVRFDASASRDDDGRIVDYAWSLDDAPLSKTGPVIDLYLARSGSHRVSVVVTDDDGRSGATSVETILGAAPSPFTIQVVFFDDDLMTLDQRRAFSGAARRWAEVIESDFAPVEMSLSENQCGPSPAFSGVVDDLVVFASIDEIDGNGGTVALAGPCYDPSNPTPPPFGYMQFDRDDLDLLTASTSLETVVLHEMGHVLGIGTLWNVVDQADVAIDPKVAPVPCYDEPDPRYTDANAVREWRAISGTTTDVPVEEGINNGTSCGHWNEFDNQPGDPANETRPDLFDELMTGYLNPTMRLSRITVGALDDLDYQVDYDAADDYSFLSLRSQDVDPAHRVPISEELRPYAIPGLPSR